MDCDFVGNVDLNGLPILNDFLIEDLISLNERDNNDSPEGLMPDADLVEMMESKGRPTDGQTCETAPSEAGAGGAFDYMFDPYGNDGPGQVNVPFESGGAQFPGAGEYPRLTAPTAAAASHGAEAPYIDPAPEGFHDHQLNISVSSMMESSSTSSNLDQKYSREPVPTIQTPSKQNTTGPPVPPRVPHAIDKSALSVKPTATMASTKDTTNSPQSDSNEAEITLQFSSVAEANEYPARAFIGGDPTVPSTQEQKVEYVKKLLRAMYSTKKTEDNDKVVQRFKLKKHCQIRLEIACWNILDACISRHEHGPLLPGEKPKAPKNSQKIETFEERMNELLKIISTCKTVVQHILEPYYMYTLIDDPHGAIHRVRSNRSLNKKKSEVMKLGKEAMHEKQVTEGDPSPDKKAGARRKGKSREDTPSTPGRGSDAAGRSASVQQSASSPAAPLPQDTDGGYGQGVQSNGGLVTPGTSSPFVAHPVVGASEQTPHENPYPTPNMGPSPGLPNLQFPHNPHYDAQHLQNTQPYYPASGYVHQYNPARPSRLQNVVDPAIMGSQQTPTTAMHPAPAQGAIQGSVGDVMARYEQYLGSSGLTYQTASDLKRPIGDLEGPNPTGGPNKKLRQ